MRKKDRELINQEDYVQVLDTCKVCRIAMVDNGKPYVVPMNFGYELKEDELTLYLHCASEGRKINVLTANNEVCFEMDCMHELIEGKTACAYSYSYASIIGDGKVEFIEDLQEKEKALEAIMKHQTGKNSFLFEEAMIKRVTVFKIVATSFTGKSPKKQM